MHNGYLNFPRLIAQNSPVEPQHKRKVGYKCNFFAENYSLGVANSKSGGCHFGTLGQFFY